MANLNIEIGSHGDPMTVHEMRRKLAEVLANLRGDQLVSFSFAAHLPHYSPRSVTPRTIIYGELAAPEND